MDPLLIAGLLIISLFIFVLLGVHIAYSLACLGVIGIFLLTGRYDTSIAILASTCFESLRTYALAVVPLFMLMGGFMSNCTLAIDLFKWANRLLRKIPGGLGVATVFANAIFAAITGVAIAAVAVFSKISTPRMLEHNYNVSFAAGSVAGSSVLGMLIPPSLMFIVYGMIAEVSIGRLFIAGIIPGIILAAMFSAGIMFLAIFKPSKIYNMEKNEKYTYKDIIKKEISKDEENVSITKLTLKTLPLILIIFMVLGGI